MRVVRCLAGAAALLLLPSLARADRTSSQGVYVDAAGGKHPWQVARSHALLWEGRAYAPVGVVFHSRSLAQPSPAAEVADAAALEKLRAAGVRDLWVDPGRGLLGCPVSDVQRLADRLEQDGFRYGFAVDDRASEPLLGCEPPMDPVPVPPLSLQSGGQFHWTARLPGAQRVHFALVDTDHDLLFAAGTVEVQNGIATIDAPLKKSRLVGKTNTALFLVPERELRPEDTGGVPDLWGAMTRYQARLSGYLKGVRFGPNLRFVMNPVVTESGTVGMEGGLFPVSGEFRVALADWLRRRISVNDLNLRWAVTQTRIPTLEIAARLVPAWPAQDPPQQGGWLIDPVEHTAYQVVARRCRIWDDYQEFRSDSLKRAMCATAATVRSAGPCVPVVYSWEGYRPLYAFIDAPTTYDGLAATLRGDGNTLATRGGALALAQAEQCNIDWWLIAGRVRQPDAAGASSLDGWQALRDTGFKGYYLDSDGIVPDEQALAGLAPLQHALADDHDLPTYLPKVCFFPALLPNSGRIARLSTGVWWVPSLARARQVPLGDQMVGYEIDSPFGADHADVKKGIILWSPTGRRQVTFAIDSLTDVTLLDSKAAPVKVKPKKDLLKVTLSDEPIIAVGVDLEKTAMFPLEAAEAALDEFDALLKQGEAERVDTAAARQLYDDAHKLVTPGSAATVYQMIQPPLQQLREYFSPYTWLEGERPLSHNFTGATFQDGTSDGRYLSLDTQRPPRDGEYQARYVVNLRKEATYQVWAAVRAPAQGAVSPLRWALDSEAPKPVAPGDASGREYAPGFDWRLLGEVKLQGGRHVLTLSVPERAGGPDGRFVAGIDAVLFSRVPFQPHGIEKPYFKARPSNARPDVAARP